MPDQKPLTNEELRELIDQEADDLLPEETIAAMARELLAARARIESANSPSLEALMRLLGIDMTDPREVLAEKVIRQRERIAELEEQARAQARGVQLSYALDLWMAIGCPLSDFDGYVERNRIADTWANLLGVVRGLFRPVCGKPTDGGPCVLTAHQIGPCHSRADVGVSEPVPHAPPIVGTETGTRPAAAQSDPDGFAVVVHLRDGSQIVQTSALLPEPVAAARAEMYRTEFAYEIASVAEVRVRESAELREVNTDA